MKNEEVSRRKNYKVTLDINQKETAEIILLNINNWQKRLGDITLTGLEKQ